MQILNKLFKEIFDIVLYENLNHNFLIFTILFCFIFL